MLAPKQAGSDGGGRKQRQQPTREAGANAVHLQHFFQKILLLIKSALDYNDLSVSQIPNKVAKAGTLLLCLLAAALPCKTSASVPFLAAPSKESAIIVLFCLSRVQKHKH